MMLLSSPRTLAAICIFGLALPACPGPEQPRIPPAASVTTEVGRTNASLLGAAASDSTTFAALATTSTSSSASSSASSASRIEARRGATVAWTRELDGRGGLLALGTDLYAAIGGTGTVAGGNVRGEPGAAIVALDPTTGTVKWRVPLDAAGWVTIGALAALPDGGVLVGGTYTNGLRAANHTVGSAGRADGFVASLRATGEVAWLVRLGGIFADTVQGVAATRTRDEKIRIAIAGTFQATADIQGAPLAFFDERSPFPDGFVAELTSDGKRVWSHSFGGILHDSVAGVAIDASGKVVVAATSTGELHVGGLDLIAQGASDGVIGWWNADGTPHNAILVGGADFDGLRGIVAAGASVVVGGFYSGSLSLGDRRPLTAGGGDDSFLAAFAPTGAVTDVWVVSGAGREEVASLAPIRGGFVAGISYTAAAQLAGANVAAPKDPMSGSAIIVRGVK